MDADERGWWVRSVIRSATEGTVNTEGAVGSFGIFAKATDGAWIDTDEMRAAVTARSAGKF